jgi:nucleotide-binding universal stress UspA family protein
MKRILVPVDGSASSHRALRHAIERTRGTQGEIHVLHVVAPIEYEELRVAVARDEIAELRKQAHQRILEDAANEVETAGAKHVAHLYDGNVAETIARLVESQHFDEVVMGTRGMGTVGSLLLGSVANRVAHLVQVPVTLVK